MLPKYLKSDNPKVTMKQFCKNKNQNQKRQRNNEKYLLKKSPDLEKVFTENLLTFDKNPKNNTHIL